MEKQAFDAWVEIDSRLQATSEEVTIETICNLVTASDKVVDDEEEENFPEEIPPKNSELVEALKIIRRVQYRGENFEQFYEFENYLLNLINKEKRQTSINEYFH